MKTNQTIPTGTSMLNVTLVSILNPRFSILALLLFLLTAWTPNASAQGGVPLWTNRYDGPSFGAEAYAIAVDSSGDVIVTGYSNGNGSGTDYATIKYSSDGIPLWTNRYNAGRAVAVDGSNNVFVTGDSWSGSDLISADYATVAYSSAGVPLWTNRYDGPANNADQAVSVAVDSSGNVLVTGYSVGSGSGSDYATIKYSNTGIPLWTNRYNGLANGDDYAPAVEVDTNGNVFVTGDSISNESGSDYTTIAYTSQGVPLWTNYYNGPGNDEDHALALTVDIAGNVLVTGFSWGGSDYDYATVAYAGAGQPLWTNRYDGPANDFDVATAVAVDNNGNVFVTGAVGGVTTDYATLAYSSTGLPLWTNLYESPGPESDWPNAVAVDSTGNVFVTGGSANGALTIKYSSSIPQPIQLAIEPDGSGGYFIRFNGIPDSTYHLLRASDLTGPWPAIATNTAPASGLVEFHETSQPPAGAFYRTLTP